MEDASRHRASLNRAAAPTLLRAMPTRRHSATQPLHTSIVRPRPVATPCPAFTKRHTFRICDVVPGRIVARMYTVKSYKAKRNDEKIYRIMFNGLADNTRAKISSLCEFRPALRRIATPGLAPGTGENVVDATSAPPDLDSTPTLGASADSASANG